jgi:hypothetical protein
MASPTQAYLTPLYFIGSLSHTDFSLISCSLFEELLQEARVAFEQDAYMLDIPPYTTPAIDQCFNLRQQTGHCNNIQLTFTE